MSATLGDSASFSKGLTEQTGAPATLVQSDQRPVPFEFEYATTQLQEKVAELNEQGRAPVYLVHFTQNACAGTARDLLSTNFCTKEEKHAIAQAIGPLKIDFISPARGLISPHEHHSRRLLRSGKTPSLASRRAGSPE